MKSRRHSTIDIVATGVLVTILACTGLFWARWLCRVMRADLLSQSAHAVTLYPSRNLKFEEGMDPNLLVPPIVTASAPLGNPLLMGLGFLHYLQTRMPGLPWRTSTGDHVYRWFMGPPSEQMYFDPSLGLIVRKGTERIRKDDRASTLRDFTYYAGPEGVSDTPDERLGRFISPIVDAVQIEPQIVYDRNLRRFFAIRWRPDDLAVKKGPDLADDGGYQPVQIGLLDKNFVAISTYPIPGGSGLGRSPSLSWTMEYVGQLVLDASGRIDRLDPETLEIRGPAGYLPMPTTLFGSQRSVARPGDVAAYHVDSLSYSGVKGTAVATLSRDGLALQLDYFDGNGVRIAGGGTMARYYDGGARARDGITWIGSEEAVYSRLPGAGGLTAAKFLLENLHPPVLVLVSYFLGPRFEATAGYRSVFLLPDSFVAMIARGGGNITYWERFFWALAYMLPGLVFLLLLAWIVGRDSVRIGLPKSARRGWMLGTVVLGLPVYLTYRLMRPKAALVTCPNCGLGRRPDLEKCHRCGSAWAVPELVPPAWRVLDEPEQAEDVRPSLAEETNPPAESEV